MKSYPYTDVTSEPYAELPGVSIRWAIGANVGAPNFYLRVIDVEPGSATGYHEHAWEHEVFVLQGKGKVRLADREVEIEKDMCVFVEPNEIHQFINVGDVTLRFICVIPKPED